MKSWLLAGSLLLGCCCSLWSQVYTSGGPTVNNVGQPVGGASVAVCSTNPGPPPVTPSSENFAFCSSHLATTYTDSGLGTPCTNNPTTLGPLYGVGCTNPGKADTRGNYWVYAASGVYWAQIYGYGFSAQLNNFQIGGSGGNAACEALGTTAGDICYYNGSSWVRLAGNSGSQKFLAETSGVPSWQTSGGTGCTLGGAVGTSIISDQGGNCYGDLDWIYNPGSNPYVDLGGSSGNAQLEIDKSLNGHNQTIFNGTWLDQQSQYTDGDANLITYDNSGCTSPAGNPACDIDTFNIQTGNAKAENGVQSLEADVSSSSVASNDLTAVTMAASQGGSAANKVVEGLQVRATSNYSGSKVFGVEILASGGVRPVGAYLDSIGGGTPHLPADGYHYDIWSENNTSSNTSQIGAYFGNDIILQPNAGGEASCSGNSSNVIISSSISNGGISYAVNDTFTIAGGTGGTGIVDAVSPTGVVLNFHVTNAGTSYSDGITTTTATIGVGTGLTLNISVDPPSRGRLHYKNGGSGVADVLEICMHKSDNSYGWVTVVTAP